MAKRIKPTPWQRKTGELLIAAYEKEHPRDASVSPFAYYAQALLWLQTPEGWQAFKDARAEAAP